MLLKRKNINVIVEQANAREMAWLRAKLTFSQQVAPGAKTGSVCMVRSAGAKTYFGGGFVRLILRAAEADGVVVHIEDIRRQPAPPRPVPTAMVQARPRYYQIEAAQTAIAATHGVIELPTGSGKTLTACMIAEALADMPVLYAVGDAVLADSMRTTYARETGREVSREPGKGRFVVMTLQALYAALRKDQQGVLKQLARFRALIVDEAHGVPAATFYKVCAAVPAFYRIAMSATPFDRSDNRTAQIFALFGGLVYRKTEGELAAEGFLPRADIRMVRHLQPPFFLGRWSEAYDLQVVRDDRRNELLADIVARAAKPCLVLYSSIAHGPAILKALGRDAGSATIVDGKASVETRKSVIRRLNDGTLEVVLASRVFSVGVDVPELRSVVIAGAGKSVIQSVQRIGRGMRMTATKRSFEVWDVLDWATTYHLTLKKDKKPPRGLWVVKHAHARMRTYRKRGHDVQILETVDGPGAVFKGFLRASTARKGSLTAAAKTV